MRTIPFTLVVLVSLLGQSAVAADPNTSNKSKDALQPFNLLIGTWRGTGQPEGTLREKQKGFWTETLTWQWQFKGDDAWLKLTVDKGKYFTGGELRYLPTKDQFELTLQTVGKEKVTFTGALKEKLLTLDQIEEGKKASKRIVINLLRDNRFLYSFEEKREGKADLVRLYQVGATKEGVPFAGGDAKPVCIVSGGLGTIKVTYKGQTYYVCCSGCREEFKEDPEKYIKEFESKGKK
jgi:YHS domain-containing protein